MSTQHAVTIKSKPAAPHARGLAWALWAWQAFMLGAGVVAWFGGAELAAVMGASALALSPALVSVLLLPRLGENSAQAFALVAWITAHGALIAGAGGANSLLGACLLSAPALAAVIGARVVETAVGAALAFALSWGVSLWAGPPAGLGFWPQLAGAGAMSFVAAMMALAASARMAPARTLRRTRIDELAHELRTPLGHIIGFSEVLEQELYGPIGSRNREYARLIGQTGGQLLELAESLLDAARGEAGALALNLETFDACNVVREVVAQFSESARTKNIALDLRLPPAPLMVKADKRALRRMLVNTLGNALKFTPEGGAAGVAARAEGGLLVLDTFDSGPGIAPVERARLAAPFVRGARSAGVEGAGLGLYLVRALAELHGGALSFHDSETGGALVRVSAPILAPQA